MDLVSSCSLESYFDPRLERALEAQGVHADPHVRHYLLRLLVQRATEVPGEPSLVELELEARTCTPAHRGRALRRVGDHALFTTGLFADRLRRRGISARYYCDKGRSAYAEAACADRPHDQAHARAVGVLARRFRDFVSVLRHFRSGTTLCPPRDAAGLLERHPHLRAGVWRAAPSTMPQ